MKTRFSKRILALLLTLLMVLSLLPMSFAEEAPKSDDLVILFTNDIHCGVDQSDSSIGIAGLAKIKKDMEATHKNVALVDNGDAIQGELIGTVSKGEYMVQLMNFVGFDYAAFGNHEYDYTMPQLKKLVDMAKVKYLSCNFRYIGETPDENAVNLDGYTVVDYDGLKVGYVGITTPESLVKSTPTYFQDENGEWIYTFCNGGNGQELYDAVQTAVDAARADGAQVVVALAHLGIDEQSAPWRSTDVIANTTGIDVMLDGHSHSTIERQEVANKNGETVLLSSTGTKLAHVGKLTVTPEGAVNTELIKRSDVDGVDPETQAYLEQIEAEFEEMKQQVVAHVDYDLLTTHPETGKRMIRLRETNLGDVCADAYRSVLEADVAFVNGGGIRANIPAGDVTYEQIINVHPYSNMGCKVKTTGQQILDALEMSARNLNMNEAGELEGENGGFLHVSGLKFTINLAIPSSVVVDESKMFVEVAGERRVQDVKILQDGKYVPIDPAGTYSLASHNYMLKDSGDGLNMFRNDELLLDEVKVDNQILIEYMSSEEFASHDYSNWEGEGRIRIVNFKGDELAGKTIILHTNDTHGALLGFAQVAQVKADFEAQGANVILVDAGDFSQGTTYVSTNKGAAAVTMLNAAGYDYVTLGNHEFDFGYAQLMENLEKKTFNAICADVYKKGTDSTILPVAAVAERDGLKIGFFGMETPETQTKVNPGLITEIDFGTNENGKFLSAAQKAVAALRDNGADLVIGLVHLGVDPESEPYRSMDLYNAVEGIDFLIDGHSHTQMTPGAAEFGGDTNPCPELPIQSTGTKASATALMNVGMIQIDNATKTIEKTELIPLGANAPVDDEVAAVAREIMDTVDAEYGAKFAESLVDLNGDRAPGNRNQETNLGDLITDSMLWSVMKDMDAETLGVPQENVVAITNGGGIRAWIRKGDVTKNDVNTVLPFGNTVAVVYVTGAELLEALEASTHCTPTSLGGFPQISGMNITIDLKKSFDQGELYPGSTYHQPASVRRVTINDVNGKDFDPEATYAVITNNFCAAGGDTYYAFHAASSQFDTGIPLDEALINFIMDPEGMNGVIGEDYAEPQGRITLKNGFDDVQDPSKYYYAPVYWAYDHEPQITGGKTETLFGVKSPCTREQIVTFLWKAYGAEQPTNTENPFTDVKEGKYYFKPVMWAKEKEITGGVSKTLFGVGKPCKREQAVTFLWKAAGAPEPKTTENPFTDVKAGKYYYKAVLWALENGVTGGVSEDKFGVGKDCTRAQIVTFLYAALEKEHEDTVRVFETTDIHGYLLDTSSGNEDTFQYRMAYLANIFNEARASEEYDDVLLLDGGDIYQGTPVSNLLQGRAIRAALDKMGYDAVALGNHEFDWGVTKNADAEGTVPAYELGSFSGDPDIPVLAYNLYEAETGEPVPFTKDYVVVEKAGYRIALIGYIPNYRGDIMAAEINPYTIDEDLNKLAEKVHEINEAEKPDVTMILAHESPAGIAKAMDPAEVDLVLGGHSHTGRAGVAENGIPYLQGNCQAQGYASANLVITRKGAGEPSVTVTDPLYTGITASSNRPNLYDTEANADKLDPVILELSHLAWDEVKDEMEEVLGWIDVPITKSGKLSDNGATRAGNWISGLMLQGTAELHPVAAFYNSGGIRTSFNIPEGETTREITTGDIYTINPFGNSWLVYELTAPEIAQQLLNGFKEPNYGDQMSGLTFTYWQEGSGKNAERGIVSITLSDGTKLDLNDNETTYRVCTTNYSATLDGSVFQDKEPIVPMADAPVDNVTIIELLRAAKAQGDGYIPVDETGRGTKVEKPQEVRLEMCFPSTSNDDIAKYGNVYADCSIDDFLAAGFQLGDLVTVKFLDQELELPVVPDYSYVDSGTPGVFLRRTRAEGADRVIFAINMGNFADTYGLATKTTNPDKSYYWTAKEGVEFPVPVTVELKEAEGYMAELLLHSIVRTNNREDYPELSDAEFANFRRIDTTGMGDHLYRGSSPINPEIGRNTYADAALEEAGVTVVMNLANSQADAEAYPGFAETYYAKQNVVYLNLGVDFFAQEFKTGLAAGLRHFAANPGVYYVHCTEGKDRAGFVSALLECLMGASYDEVVADYLKTYTNYYTVVDGVQQPLSQETLDAIAQSNIIKTLQRAFGVEDLKNADLAAEAEAYVKELGLSDEELAALKTNLGGGNQPSVKTSFPSATKADIDKYGDVHLSISSADLAAAGFAYKDLVKLSFLDQELIVPIIPQYRYVGAKAVGLVMWEDGTKPAEVEVFNGSFAASYGLADVVREGSDYTVTPREGVEFPVPVTIELYEKQGYADTYAIFDLTRSNNREDYRGSTEPYPNLTDEEFANFRKISTTGMGEGTLYRSSSPINPSIGRNGYADAAAEAAGIKSFVNLADSAASAAKYAGYAETYYSNQNIAFLNLGVDFTTELNREGVVSAMDFIAAEDSEAPFLVHCNEGQDRAGFVSGLLECLMGASAEEVIEDYMITFYNYYGVQKGSDQYAQISNNIVKNLSTAFGIETADFASADLAQEAADYLKELGVSEETIAAVKEKLGGAAGSEAEFEFLITSDIHGQFFATDYTRPYEQSGTHNQGMTRISTYLKEQKAEYGDNAYIVDMGDTFQGAPLTYYYAFNKPEVEDPAIKTFRHIGYDMWIVGNHEFNYGLDILTRQMDYAVSPSTENEKQLTISMANYLKAETNNDETKDWATWRDVAPYVIKDFDGVKVAIIGFGNPNIPQWDVPANWEGIYFANIIDTYKHYEPEMLEQADMIVAVAHSGIGSDPDSDFMERLINATDSIAFAFSGHEHGSKVYEATNAKGETVPILQPGTKARYVAKVVVNYDKAEGSYEIAPELVDLRNYPLDEALVEILQPYETDTWENYMLQPIGKALGDFPAANLGTAPSAFVDLINTVQLWGAYDRGGVNTPDDPSDDSPAMLSITAPLTAGNNANLISEGDIYLGDMFGLYRFENWFYQITMSGEEVHQWLEYSASKLVADGNGGYNIQGGLTYYDIIYGEGFHYDFDVSKPAGERVVNMSYNGQPVTADQEFTVVVNNYRYNGGGDYVKYLNEHGCSFTPNDPDRIIYSTQFDMIQGEDEGQARTLLTRYIQQETEAHGGITPTILSDWRILDGSEEPTEPSFVKVTGSSDLTDGVYLIVYEADGYAMDGSLENMDVVKDYVALSIQDGKIEATDELKASAFNIDMSAGTIANAGGVYIGRSSDANGLEQSASPLTNSISIDAEGNAVIQSGGAYLRFNSASDQLRFRYYKSSTYTRQKAIALYKLVEG